MQQKQMIWRKAWWYQRSNQKT